MGIARSKAQLLCGCGIWAGPVPPAPQLQTKVLGDFKERNKSALIFSPSAKHSVWPAVGGQVVLVG